MCKVVVTEVLGANKSRGFRVMEIKTGDVFGVTEYDMKKQLKDGGAVLGLTLDKNERVVLDGSGFYQNNIMIETSLTSMKPMIDSPVNVLYTLVGVEGSNYILVGSRFGRMVANEFKLRAMCELGMIAGGVKLESDGTLKVSELLVPKAPKEKVGGNK